MRAQTEKPVRKSAGIRMLTEATYAQLFGRNDDRVSNADGAVRAKPVRVVTGAFVTAKIRYVVVDPQEILRPRGR